MHGLETINRRNREAALDSTLDYAQMRVVVERALHRYVPDNEKRNVLLRRMSNAVTSAVLKELRP